MAERRGGAECFCCGDAEVIAINNSDQSGLDGNIATIALSALLLAVRIFSD